MSKHASNDGLARLIDALFKSIKVKTIPNTKRRFNNTIDKLANFDYAKLIPEPKVSRGHQNFALGAEFTLRYCGPGIGLGLGKVDVWIGWPPNRI